MQWSGSRLTGAALLVVGVLCAVVFSIFVGTRPTTIGEILTALGRPWDASTDIGAIVWSQRLPRTLLGLAVGASMALAGALIQGHTRNPLADPGILGISQGAAFAVVLGVFVFGATSTDVLVWFALLGAIFAAVTVFAISSIGTGAASPLTLVLVGAATTALFNALTTTIILRDQAGLNELRQWNTGSLTGRDLSVLAAVAPFLLVGAALAFLSAPTLNVLGAGDDIASSLGVNVPVARLLGLTGVTLLAGAATAAAGPIVFVGLVVPHAVRLLVGTNQCWIMPMSALAGALLMVLADVFGRILTRPSEIPGGIVIAFIGVPVFLALVRRRSVATT
ncbi:FecCD family ABC transporter permease [Dermatophilus congolensis]|nr:iron ABC transporter permease [Dermatophilus congolensis]